MNLDTERGSGIAVRFADLTPREQRRVRERLMVPFSAELPDIHPEAMVAPELYERTDSET